MPGKSKAAYGWDHQQARRIAHANFVDGTPCPFCGRPMRVWMKLDLDHTVPVSRGGMGGPVRLAHAYCNRRAGGLIGNRSPKRKYPTRRTVGRTQPGRRLPSWLSIKECLTCNKGMSIALRKGQVKGMVAWSECLSIPMEGGSVWMS